MRVRGQYSSIMKFVFTTVAATGFILVGAKAVWLWLPCDLIYFAGYRQKDTDLPGRLVSNFFLYHGEEILVFADIGLQVFLIIDEALDKSGGVVFEKKIAKTITASVVPGMPHLTGKVQLISIVSSAHLFSFALNTSK